MCVVIYQLQRKCWEYLMFTIRVMSRLTALLTRAASLGWTSAVTCNMYTEPRICIFYVIIIRTSILRVPSLKLCLIENVTRSNSRIVWMTVFAQLCFILFHMQQYHAMHTLPLPLCGLYNIRVQNYCGQRLVRPCQIVLLTLVVPRGVTDLHLSWGINIEHAQTAYDKTCGTVNWVLRINNHIVDVIYEHQITNGT